MNVKNIDSIGVTTDGFFGGVLTGYALKKVLKVIAVAVRLFSTGLVYLQYRQIIDIKWSKLHRILLHPLQMPFIARDRIVAAIKGYASRFLRKEFPHLRSSLPTLWTRRYFVSTHGHVSSETIKKYIEERQRGI